MNNKKPSLAFAWGQIIQDPSLLPERFVHAAAIGYYRQGAKFEKIAAILKIPPSYAEEIITQHLSLNP